MNNNKQTGGVLAAVFLTILTLNFSFYGVVNASNIKDSTRPFPLLPASIEESTHNGKKGCMPSDENYLLGVTENEGLISLGAQRGVVTSRDGPHSLVIAYHPTKDYGYRLTNKADGKLCASEKLQNFEIQPTLQISSISNPKPFTAKDCSFTKRYTDMCASFNRLALGLQKNGFKINWRAEKPNGDILSILSSKDKSYYLTTSKDTGATVITGSALSPFEFINIPE